MVHVFTWKENGSTNDIFKKRYVNVFLVQIVVDSEGGRESRGQ